MKPILALAAVCVGLHAQSGPAAAPPVSANGLTTIRRVYVGELTGAEAETIRQLLIASLDSTHLFALTENPERADAILKGAADDQAFTDTLEVHQGVSARENSGRSVSNYARSGSYSGLGIAENEGRRSKERKHEAYASVRLCNRDGDVLWSTTQESSGAKFRGAGADVAAKVAHQLTLDMERARRGGTPPPKVSETSPH